MTSKQNLRINVLAAALLSISAGSAFAASPRTEEPKRPATAAQQSSNGIIVKYRAGSAAASDRSAKLAVSTRRCRAPPSTVARRAPVRSTRRWCASSAWVPT